MAQNAPVRNGLKIAIIGTRGIPACYGGFETFAEELSTRLVERGHEVVVYGRSHVIELKEPRYRGVNIKLLWAPQHKYLETPVHSLCSLLHSASKRYDVILLCNAANSPFAWISRLRGTPIVINVDGIERERKKWNAAGRAWYLLGEFCSVLFANRVISDAEVIKEYYQERYRTDSTVIRYGSDSMPVEQAQAKCLGDFSWMSPDDVRRLSALNLTPGQYLLYVSRLEPENNADKVIAAFNNLPEALKHKPLVIVGDAPYAGDYIAKLKAMAGPAVFFTGYRFGEEYRALQRGAYLYFQATEVGGTHPALVEAMGAANAIISNGTPENSEVLHGTGVLYEKNNVEQLGTILSSLLGAPEEVLRLRAAAYARARQEFAWEEITSRYEELFQSVLSHK